MTVSELKKQLAEFDDKDIVVMSKDGEGNGFSPLADLGSGIYVPDSNWSGELHNFYESKKEADAEDDEFYEGDDGQKALVLWPTN